MALQFWKPSRIFAVVLILAAGGWIGSGMLYPHAEEKAKVEDRSQAPSARQKVGVIDVMPQGRSQVILLSGVTSADRRAFASARAAGTIRELKVAKGARVAAGDVIALLSDEGREAGLRQAQAVLDQRNADLIAQKALIDAGTLPRNQINALQSQLATAQSALSTAQAEMEKIRITSPIAGLVDSMPVQLGQAIQIGNPVAEIVSPDPMLAVGYVTEKDRGAVKLGNKVAVRLIDGREATGEISFVALSGEKGTRTYRLEARIANANAAIADGVTCELAITLDPIQATPVPRSALVFSDSGELGVTIVDAQGIARFKPVSLVDDQRAIIWVKGLAGPVKLISVGQAFVKDGDAVEALPAPQGAQS